MLADCGLVDGGYLGSCFTWEWGNLPETNIRERLIGDDEFLMANPFPKLWH